MKAEVQKLRKMIKVKKDEFENQKLPISNFIVKNPYKTSYSFTLIPEEAIYLLIIESEFPIVKFQLKKLGLCYLYVK